MLETVIRRKHNYFTSSLNGELAITTIIVVILDETAVVVNKDVKQVCDSGKKMIAEAT